MLSEDMTEHVHAHPEEMLEGTTVTEGGGPDLVVPRALPEAGQLPHLAAVPAQQQAVDGAVYGASVAVGRDGGSRSSRTATGFAAQRPHRPVVVVGRHHQPRSRGQRDRFLQDVRRRPVGAVVCSPTTSVRRCRRGESRVTSIDLRAGAEPRPQRRDRRRASSAPFRRGRVRPSCRRRRSPAPARSRSTTRSAPAASRRNTGPARRRRALLPIAPR